FTDPKAAEIEYFRRTGIFPIMHTVGIPNEILEQHPWAAGRGGRGFQKPKKLWYARMRNPRVLAMVFAEENMKEQRAVFGADPWPYNLEANRRNLEGAIQYACNEGMIKAPPKIEALFFPASLDGAKRYLGAS